MSKPRVLVLLPGPVPPAKNEVEDRFFHLSQIAEGEILLPVWWKSVQQAQDKLGLDASLRLHRGNFTYHLLLADRFPPGFRRLAVIIFYLVQSLMLNRRGKPFDIVLTYGSNVPGIVGVILRWLTRAKLLCEIPGAPDKAFLFDNATVSPRARWKKQLADAALLFTLRNAAGVKLLYPTQLINYQKVASLPAAVFHEFVPISALRRGTPEVKTSPETPPYVLLLGFPWHLKGVDVLLRAYRRLSDSLPQLELRIVGYCPDRSPYELLRNGDSRIQFLNGLPHQEAMRMISEAFALAVPSRTEAMGRVILEAMALRCPVVASNVDGIPFYVRHEETGLLFPSEDDAALATAIRRLAEERDLRQRLIENAHAEVFRQYSEKRYVEEYGRFLKTVAGS